MFYKITCHTCTCTQNHWYRSCTSTTNSIFTMNWWIVTCLMQNQSRLNSILRQLCGPSTSSCLSMSKRRDLEHPRAPQLPWKQHLFNKIDWCSWGKAVSVVSWVIHHWDGLKTFSMHKPPWWGKACKIHNLHTTHIGNVGEQKWI